MLPTIVCDKIPQTHNRKLVTIHEHTTVINSSFRGASSELVCHLPNKQPYAIQIMPGVEAKLGSLPPPLPVPKQRIEAPSRLMA